MIQRAIHIILGILAFSFLYSCEKDSDANYKLLPEKINIYEDENIKYAVGAVAGDDVVLLTYTDLLNNYHFKLVDNSGSELWDKTFGYNWDHLQQNSLLHVIYDSDNTFAIFYENSLKKINISGDVVFYDSLFLDGLNFTNGGSFQSIILGNNDSYLLMGSISISGNRAFVSEYSRSGEQNFLKLFTQNVSGFNLFSSGMKNTNGGYTIAGSFASNTEALNSSFFIVNLDANGNIVNSKINEVEDFTFVGNELITLENGNLAYLLSPENETLEDKRSRIYEIDDLGNIVRFEYIDLASQNFSVGRAPFFGSGIVQNQDGGFIGLMKAAVEIPTDLILGIPGSYIQPHYGYVYTLDQNARVLSQFYINRSYTNYFNSMAKLSNGQILMFGTTLSLGEDLKLNTIIK